MNGLNSQAPAGRSTYSHVGRLGSGHRKTPVEPSYKYVLLASMLATAGDLVFTGNPEGEFFAMDAKPAAACGAIRPAPATAEPPSPTR